MAHFGARARCDQRRGAGVIIINDVFAERINIAARVWACKRSRSMGGGHLWRLTIPRRESGRRE